MSASASSKIYRSPWPPTSYPLDRSLAQFMLDLNPGATLDDKVILEDDSTGKSYTYSGLRRAAARAAWGWNHKASIQRGDTVAVVCHNCADYVLASHSLIWTGAIAATINHMGTAHDLARAFIIAEPKAILVSPELLPRVEEAMAESSFLYNTQVYTISGRAEGYLLFPEDILGINESDTLPPLDLTGEDSSEVPAFLLFTSGTTSEPKGALISHHQQIRGTMAGPLADPDVYSSDMRQIFFPPMSHLFGTCVVTCSAVWFGSYIKLMKSFDLHAFVRMSAEIRAQVMNVIPPIMLAIAKDPTMGQYDFTSLRSIMCGAATLDDSVVKAVKRRCPNAVIVQTYGSTEINIAALVRKVAEGRGASVGKPMPDREIRLVDDSFADVAQGQEGEIIVRAPKVGFIGYKDQADATAAAFRDEWYLTGDLGTMDVDGYLYITGRKKELIKYKGLQIAPVELESILASHAAVKEAGVGPIYDSEHATEVPVGYVTLQDEAKSRKHDKGLIAELRRRVDEQVANHKKLRGGIVVLDEMPKTGSGKILRRLLASRAEEQRKREEGAKL